MVTFSCKIIFKTFLWHAVQACFIYNKLVLSAFQGSEMISEGISKLFIYLSHEILQIHIFSLSQIKKILVSA